MWDKVFVQSIFHTKTGIKFCEILVSDVETSTDWVPRSSHINFGFSHLMVYNNLSVLPRGISCKASILFDLFC